MTAVFTKQARKNAKGTIFAPGKDEGTGKYFIFTLCENYDGKVRGGIRKTWRVVKNSEKGLSLDEAKSLFEKKLGKNFTHNKPAGLRPRPSKESNVTDKIDKTNAERQARFREKSRTAGLKRKVVWIPIEREEELIRNVAEWVRIKQEGTPK